MKNKETKHQKQLIKLAKIYRLICTLEKQIFCEESFISTYKQITKLFKKDFQDLFLYKQEYETNAVVLNYCIKLLKNQFHLLQINSYYYDVKISIKAENYFLRLKKKLNV